MDDWRAALNPGLRARVGRVEAAGGVFRWYDEVAAEQKRHFLHGVLYGIPMVGAGPLDSPLSPSGLERAVSEVSERLATVLGVPDSAVLEEGDRATPPFI